MRIRQALLLRHPQKVAENVIVWSILHGKNKNIDNLFFFCFPKVLIDFSTTNMGLINAIIHDVIF